MHNTSTQLTARSSILLHTHVFPTVHVIMYCETSLSKCMADIAPMSQYSHITGVTYVSVLTQHDEDIPAAWLFDSVFQLRGPDESFSGSGSSSMNRTPCSRRCLLRL